MGLPTAAHLDFLATASNEDLDFQSRAFCARFAVKGDALPGICKDLVRAVAEADGEMGAALTWADSRYAGPAVHRAMGEAAVHLTKAFNHILKAIHDVAVERKRDQEAQAACPGIGPWPGSWAAAVADGGTEDLELSEW